MHAFVRVCARFCVCVQCRGAMECHEAQAQNYNTGHGHEAEGVSWQPCQILHTRGITNATLPHVIRPVDKSADIQRRVRQVRLLSPTCNSACMRLMKTVVMTPLTCGICLLANSEAKDCWGRIVAATLHSGSRERRHRCDW